MKSILIIEDDPNIVAALEVRLNDAGYATLSAGDAVTGFGKALQNLPDLVVLDITMPAGDGLHVAQKLRSHQLTREIPFVFVTANRDPELRERVMELGAAGLFEKPYNAEELLAVIGHALGETGMFRRPIARYSPPAETSAVKPGGGGAKKVLIVEDDEKIALALSLRLQSAGYETHTAADALTGVHSALSSRPDLVLLDISLPAGNGFTVAERVRRSSDSKIPIIFLTASKQPGFRERALELGAAGYFEKPYEAEALLTAVNQHLGG